MFELEDEYAGSGETFAAFQQRWKKWPELFLVYKKEGTIIGEISPFVSETHVEIRAIAVEYDYWGQGIGRALIDRFEAAGTGYDLPFQVASALNVTGFYQKLGYQPSMVLWFTQESDATNDIKPDDVIDIETRSGGYKAIYLDVNMSSDELNRLRERAGDDLSLLHEKPA